MRKLRLLIVSVLVIFVLALGVLAFVSLQDEPDPGDVIIIKGGSLELQCGARHDRDCMGRNDNKGKYKAKKESFHVTRIRVRDVNAPATIHLDRRFPVNNPPLIEIEYKAVP
ncbi:MAG TPA: hypothetical protein VGW36_10090 [Pyrinomonadaceae bacterium]|nr:hypothetical protein [Pyrinomonadaceae bacterium]